MKKLIQFCAAFAVLAVLAPAAARAQDVNAILKARGDSITVGDYCQVANSVLATNGVVGILGADSSDARLHAALICDPLMSRFSLSAVTGLAAAPVGGVAKIGARGSSAARGSLLGAMSGFRATVRGVDVRQPIRAAISPETDALLIRISETANGLVTFDGQRRALTRLANYERKLGPNSPRLNGVEVLLNFAAQRWIPGFRPTVAKGPSALELVTSYAPGYLTMIDGHAEAVSTSEFGVRFYLFGDGFGKTGTAGLLKPSYWSVGVVTVSDRNGALVWPWQGAEQTGAFVSWGDVKVAYVTRMRGEWLFSKQFQVVPFVF